jgi:hypothetical protein
MSVKSSRPSCLSLILFEPIDAKADLKDVSRGIMVSF